MKMLAFPEKSTSFSVRMPDAATVPKSTRPAPPSTGIGTAATIAPAFGSSPRTMRIAPP